ncbi:MAG: polysaccharide pyruvyl transferase family protein [Candidatus Aenigmatarchaeota archaeon]
MESIYECEIKFNLASSEECTGCGACYNACDFDAISMEFNEEGFLEPNLIIENCKNCKICSKVCPVINPIYINSQEPFCYAAQAEDELRRISSSGGVFTLLAEWIIKNNVGFVAGAAWNKNFLVEHILINEIEKLDLLRKSKYIQSNTKKIFKDVEKLLNDNKIVLFSGTPCQIAGLYGYLRGDRPNLYTVEVMCHSVASPGAFLRYLKENFNFENVASINFRDKTFDWSTQMYGLTITLRDGNLVRIPKKYDIFLKSFDICLSTRKACGNCKFSKLPRQADITLADFWGISELYLDLADALGTSLVIVNNRKGMYLFSKIENRLKKIKSVPLDFVKKLGQPLEKPFKSHPRRDRFFKLLKLKNYSFKKAYYYATKNLYDVGVVGLWFSLNYGSCLTYYGLSKQLSDLGLSILLIDKPKDFGDDDLEKKDTHTRRFVSKFFDISESLFMRDFYKYNLNCDIFLVGSDQVWNYGISTHFGNIFYLDFVEDFKKKLSYASSFGHAEDFTPDSKKIEISHLLKRFDHISVREKDSLTLLKDTYGVNADWVLDPIFFCEITDFENIASMSKMREKEDYILAYILDATNEIRDFIIKLSKMLGMKIVTIIDPFPHTHEKNIKILGFENIFKNLDIEDFIYFFSSNHCKYCVTDSYHGLILSIIFKKPFSVFINRTRGSLRFENIAEITDPELLKSRFILELPTLESIDYTINKHIVNLDNFNDKFDIIRNELNKHRLRSLEWLKKSLLSKKIVEDFKIYESVFISKNKHLSTFEHEINLKKKMEGK